MRLNLKSILQSPGPSLPFAFSLDLSDIALNGEFPMPQPVTVEGVVRNRAGALVFHAKAAAVIALRCDRCAKPFTREHSTEFETLLATQMQDEEHDDIVLIEGDEVDAGELMRTAFLLSLDSKNLCDTDCRGLCPGCGADLNIEPCRCKREIDPRLAGLAKFLEQQDHS